MLKAVKYQYLRYNEGLMQFLHSDSDIIIQATTVQMYLSLGGTRTKTVNSTNP
jgi:hypothetical protein